jgi:SAM-dependent methyltransferase
MMGRTMDDDAQGRVRVAAGDGHEGPAVGWNHNAAYHRFIRREVPHGAGDLLDVGCGQGRLVRELAGPGRRVLGIDPDEAAVERARAVSGQTPGIAFETAGFLDRELPAESFDFVCFLASLHHLDQAAALAKAREVLRSGGRLVVVGLAVDKRPAETLVSGALLPFAWFCGLRPEHVEPAGMRTLAPTLSWGEIRELARRTLPGARYRRRLYFRYSLVWTKP